jgi:eukaryotic-like serine/threonine-protein kinase
VIGQTISHYRIVEELGSGGMGLFTRPKTRARIASLLTSPMTWPATQQALARFEREAPTKA